MSASEPLSAGRLAEYRELAAELEQARTLPGGAWKASELDEKSVLPPKDLPTQYVVEDHLATKHSLIRSSVGVFGDERHARFTAAAREALPALLAEVARLTARVARLENSEAAGQRVIARMSREARGLEDELVRRQRRIADLADRTETAETHIAEYQALELGDLDGRVSASCPNPSHPTWLREADDIRACPWCRIAELEQVTQPQTTARGLTSREAAFRLLGSAVADPKLAAAYIKAADEEREATIAARAEQAGGDR